MILSEKKGLKHLIGLRHFYAKPDRSNNILLLFLLFMIATAAALEFTAFSQIREVRGWSNLMIATYGLFFMTMFFWALVWQSNPGLLKKDPRFDFMTLMETFDPRGLCPTCSVINTPRSFHCMVCNKCVERFDHHCPWVNNCVGHNNFFRFYAYLLFQLAYLLALMFVMVRGKYES